MSEVTGEPDIPQWDRTLVDAEIRALCQSNQEFIKGFVEADLDGASYTLHAGNQLWTAEYRSDTDGIVLAGYPIVPLKGNEYAGMHGFRIPPRRNAVIRTKESLHLPADMMGRLTLRAGWAQRGLSYPGAIVDPGYFGYLFIAIDNGLDEYMEIPVQVEGAVDPKGKDGLIKMQLTQLPRASDTPYTGAEVTELHPSRYPRTPQLEPYSPVQLRSLVDDQAERLKEIDRRIQSSIDDLHRQLEMEKQLTRSNTTNAIKELTNSIKAERDAFERKVQTEFDLLKQSVYAEQKILRSETLAAFRAIEYGFFAVIAGVFAAVGTAAVNIVGRSANQSLWLVAAIAILTFCAITIALYAARRASGRRGA